MRLAAVRPLAFSFRYRSTDPSDLREFVSAISPFGLVSDGTIAGTVGGRYGQICDAKSGLQIGSWKMALPASSFEFPISVFFPSRRRTDVLILVVMSARRHKHSDASS